MSTFSNKITLQSKHSEFQNVDYNECCEYFFDKKETNNNRDHLPAVTSSISTYVQKNSKHYHVPYGLKKKPILYNARSRKISLTETPTTSQSMAMKRINFLPRSHEEPLAGCGAHSTRMRHTYSDAAMDSSSPTNIGTCERQSLNAIYDVSNKYMRVAGYSPGFKWLLSNGSTFSTSPTAATSTTNVDLNSILTPSGGWQADDNEDEPEEQQQLLEEVKECDEEAIVIDESSMFNRVNELKKDHGRVGRRVGRPQNFYALQKRGKNVYHTRKQLLHKRTKACDLSVILAIAGILITVTEAELSAFDTIAKGGHVSDGLKSLVVISTIILLALIIKYHWLTAKILLITSGADDWRVTIQYQRVLQCALEVLICVICPVPGNIEIDWQVLSASNHRTYDNTKVPLDAVLSVPMFLRTYLVCRFIALHNRRYQDPSTRSIAALNYVNVDFPFALKTMMHERPLRVLVIFAVTFWVIMSWLLTQCERYSGLRERNQYLNSIWLIIITFTSIGYGDLIPQTYCGRALAITTGIMGAGVSSAMIAVISRRMELTRAEKHVNQFINDSKLTQTKKETAAKILQHTWFIHRYKKFPGRIDQHKLRAHQRKFLNAINQFRCIKWNQRKLNEHGQTLLDLPKLQNQMQQSLCNMRRGQETLAAQIEALDKGLDRLILIKKNSRQQPPRTLVTE